MPDKQRLSWLKLLGIINVSAALAVLIACTTDAPTATPSAALSTTGTGTSAPASNPPSTRVSQQESPTPQLSPTHRPRQHSSAHIQGLGEPVDTPHFIDSFPNHSQTLTQSPARVGLNFDIALAEDSRIIVERDGEQIAVGAIEFDPRRIHMSTKLPDDFGNGLYHVLYTACFADTGCSDGMVGFHVNAARAHDFVDLTGQQEVTIHLKDVTYQPNHLVISPGTTVIWVNDDSFEHFVNSDPHPSHNAFLPLNSLDIPPTGNFSFTFDEPGEYAFHCSAHVPQNMFGTILVRADAQVAALPTSDTPTTAAPTAVALAVTTATPTASPLPPTIAPTVVVPTTAPTPEPSATPLPPKLQVPEADLPPQRFAAHFVWSEPGHTDLLTDVPSQVRVHFDFTLARNSNIEVRKDGEKLPLDGWELSENRLQMTVNLLEAGAGMYHVLFNACWPDKSCHPGEFAFVVQ